MAGLEVSIIVPTYNRAGLLKQCLDALLQLDYPPSEYEILVVDDGSSDNTPDLMRGYDQRTPRVGYFQASHRGPAAARNIGVKAAQGDYFFFTDDDCLVEPDWIQRHLAHYKNPKVGGVGGVLVPLKPDYVNELEMAEYLEEYRTFMRLNDPNSRRGLATNNASYRRDAFATTEGFDEAFPFAAGEDIDLSRELLGHDYDQIPGLFDERFTTGADPEFSQRMLQVGYELIKDPAIKAYHQKRDSFWSLVRTKFRRGCGSILSQMKHQDSFRLRHLRPSLIPPGHLRWFWERFLQVHEGPIDLGLRIKFMFLVTAVYYAVIFGRIYYYFAVARPYQRRQKAQLHS